MALDGGLAELVARPRTGMRRRVLEHDWSSTPLGAERTWSDTLRTAVGTAVNSRFPMLLMWGPELVGVYNDGYAPMLGSWHPDALGRRAPEVWAGVWPEVEGMVAEVFAGRATYAEDLPLVVSRNGFEEETYFTFSYSPIMEPGGRVAGLLNTVVETTAQVLATRRLQVLQELGSLPRSVHGSSVQACAAALRVLARARTDCPFALVHLALEDGVEQVASAGTDGLPPAADAAVREHVTRALAGGRAVELTGLDRLGPGISRAGASPVGTAAVHTAVVEPLVLAGQTEPVGAIVLGTSPHLRMDDEYRTFLSLVAGQVAAAVTDARAVERERRRAADRARAESERARYFADVAVTLQRSFLGPTALPEGFAVHYAPATSTLEVGGDWYDVVDLPGGLFGVVVGDVVGRGLDAAAVMGQLRSAARALLLESRSPGQVLTALDRFADVVPGAVCSTVFCAVVDPVQRVVRYSSAGHLPAISVGGDGAVVLLDGARGLPLAVALDAGRPEVEVELPAGAALLLYTDGLVERRAEVLDEGIARAARVLTEAVGAPACVLAGRLVDQLLGDARDDDVAFLVYRAAG